MTLRQAALQIHAARNAQECTFAPKVRVCLRSSWPRDGPYEGSHEASHQRLHQQSHPTITSKDRIQRSHIKEISERRLREWPTRSTPETLSSDGGSALLPKALKKVGSCIEKDTAQRTAKMQARIRRGALASRRCAVCDFPRPSWVVFAMTLVCLTLCDRPTCVT